MKKNIQKPLSVFLSLTMLASLSGCTNIPGETGAVVGESTSFVESMEVVQEPASTEIVSTDLSALESYLEALLLNYPDINVLSVLQHPEDYTQDEQMLAGYINLKVNGLSILDVKDNLHRILTLGQVPRCASNEEFIYATGKLLDIVPAMTNPFACYFALAKMVHLYECPLPHGLNEFGVFSCDSLMDEYNTNYREIPIEEFLDEYLFNNDLYLGLKEYAGKNAKRMDDIIWELENVVTYGLLPGMGMDEAEWNILFGNLLVNTPATESLFEKFAPLAKEVHNILYPDDQVELGREDTMLIRVKKEG